MHIWGYIGKLMIEKYLTGKLTAEDEALATDIQNRRIDYGLQERQFMENS